MQPLGAPRSIEPEGNLRKLARIKLSHAASIATIVGLPVTNFSAFIGWRVYLHSVETPPPNPTPTPTTTSTPATPEPTPSATQSPEVPEVAPPEPPIAPTPIGDDSTDPALPDPDEGRFTNIRGLDYSPLRG